MNLDISSDTREDGGDALASVAASDDERLDIGLNFVVVHVVEHRGRHDGKGAEGEGGEDSEGLEGEHLQKNVGVWGVERESELLSS